MSSTQPRGAPLDGPSPGGAAAAAGAGAGAVGMRRATSVPELDTGKAAPAGVSVVKVDPSKEKASILAHAHPLDPLRPEEISAAVQTVRLAFGKDRPASSSICFIECALEEPHPKDIPMLPLEGETRPAKPPPQTRHARLITYDRDTNMTSEWLVALTVRQAGKATRTKGFEGHIVSQELLKDVQPALDAWEYEEAERVVKQNPDFQAAMARRGVTDMDLVMADPWCVGYFKEDDGPARRLCRALCFVRTPGGPVVGEGPDADLCDNGFARPVEGLIVRVDLQKMEVISVVDKEIIPIPEPDPLRNYVNKRGEVVEDTHPAVRPMLPLQIVQPQGPSFKVEGYNVTWDKWSFRVGFTPKEGLVIHTVSIFDPDKNRQRPVARRLSVAEMVVPYADPHDPHYLKNAFDAGEDGLGKNAHSLELNCDCLGVIHYFDAYLTDYRGGLVKIPNAICMHEEDFGLLWKHKDWRSGHTASKRSRRLVVSFLCTIANYEYGFFWYFYRDGTIQQETKLTGILSTGVHRTGKEPKYGALLDAKGLYAPYHQHIFVARVHMAVDSDGLSNNHVVEVNCKVEARGPHNPHHNTFTADETVLRSELMARRPWNFDTQRHWHVRSNVTKNRAGGATGWRLVPGHNTPTYSRTEAMYLRRAGFLRNHLWVTPFNPFEKFPGGDYPNQNPREGDGLPFWTQQDRSLEDQGIVLWYCYGLTHLPRMEDWPVMPCEYIGFRLQPHSFFDRSPCVGPVDSNEGVAVACELGGAPAAEGEGVLLKAKL